MSAEVFYSVMRGPFEALGVENFSSVFITVIIVFAALAAVCFSLWNLKERRDDNRFDITLDTIGAVSDKIRDVLTAMRATKREITSSLLLLEETVVRMQENAMTGISVQVGKMFGDISLSLSALGEPYNPFASVTSWDTESEDYLRDIIFRANKANLSYSRRSGKNYVTIKAHQAGSRMMYYTLGAMILGIAAGIGMKYIPNNAALFIANGIFGTVQTLFMNAITMLLAPVVFLSLTTSLSELSGGGEIGRIGGKTIGIYFFTSVMAVFLGFVLSAAFFGGQVPQLPDTLAVLPDTLRQSADVTVGSMLIGIIPNNIVGPVLNGNMLQVVFVAVFAGITLSVMGQKVVGLKSIIGEANELFQKMTSAVIACMPIAAFVSMGQMMYASDLSSLLSLVLFVAAIIIGCAVIFILYALIIAAVAHISPLPYLKKAPSFLIEPFALSSSNACIPFTLDFCKKKLGVSNKISSFVVPLGASIDMSGYGMAFVLSSIMLAKMCGVQIDGSICVKIGLMAFLLSIGAPGVPNSGLVCVVTILAAIHVPVGAIGFIVGIWSLIDHFLCIPNVNGDVAASIIVAKSEGELDLAVYKG